MNEKTQTLIQEGKYSEAFAIASEQDNGERVTTLFAIGLAVVEKVNKPKDFPRRDEWLKRAVNALMRLEAFEKARELLSKISAENEDWVKAICHTLDQLPDSRIAQENFDTPTVA